jgi:hypothetical protein
MNPLGIANKIYRQQQQKLARERFVNGKLKRSLLRLRVQQSSDSPFYTWIFLQKKSQIPTVFLYDLFDAKKPIQ